ncbi:LysM peptidoglycan-binding domain-containing protein [Anaerotignum sp.]|uniref:LysM peptidoglycan-binding domain-containing protein n=1 Tax=Anaerotignum sp. TaxID=2039241 RepID=UPI002A90CCFF|nr:LysM peptidoglycan-binding domain-containing protein [Anaerotignum sp.]MCI7657319.1 LysM peptidoglycan-binding domain-containing protein [Clostridia bacterium]MDY5415543.1 LysM peptidoglycan-binding domain-containing protein [Anaerotignum sp.]
MRYYFDGDSNLYGYHSDEKPFAFPTKVKQMGAVDHRRKIYVEDYVYTYLYQYGKSRGCTEKVAALVGRQIEIDGEEILMICGAIQGRDATEENGTLTFSAATWEYVGSQMDKYFQGMTLVGWVHCQPGFGAFLMSKDEAFHKLYFQEPWQVLFVVDPVDKLDTFYIYNEEADVLQQAKGYFVYYEKNEEMQEYMLDHSVVKPKEAKNTEEGEEIEGTVQEKAEKEVAAQEGPRRRRRPTPEERIDAAQEIRRVLQRRAKEAEAAQRSKYTMLTSVSCILCVICLCLGYGLFSNLNRLEELETKMAMVQDSYTVLAENVEDVKVQAAFAPRMAAVVEKETEETEQQEEIQKTEGRIHVVEAGETLGSISEKYYGDGSGVEKIMKANGLDDPNRIVCGQELLIP